LPIPVLDGGHLLFLLIEGIKGSRFPSACRATARWSGWC
jgi:membrane-associated protease RseP (regulator of RpoE activity)